LPKFEPENIFFNGENDDQFKPNWSLVE